MQKPILPGYKSKIVKTIIYLNVLVFICWQISLYQGWLQTMADHFLVSWHAVVQGRIWTLLTSVFSHNSLLHLFVNMFVLRSFGPILVQVLGRKKFLAFFLIAGLSGSIFHITTSAYLIDSPEQQALGASGAIAGIILLFSLLFPKEKILLLGIIPIAAIWGALLFIGVDAWGLIQQTKGGGLPIGHGAHLGGAFIGIVTYWLIKARVVKLN